MSEFNKKLIEIEDLWKISTDKRKPDWVKKCIEEGIIKFVFPILEPNKYYLVISTQEGNITSKMGDYLLKGDNGELIHIFKDIFENV